MEDDNVTVTINETSTSFQAIRFALLLSIEIPAILCTLLILIYLCRYRRTMITKALRNHPILLLTIITFFYITLDLPFTINTYRLGYDWPRTPSFCLWWYWIDFTLIIASLLLTAVASIQRHILVFNTPWLHQRRTRFVLHYIPLSFCVIYPSIFYLIVICFYPCDNSMEDYSQYCPAPCYSMDSVLISCDWLLNTIVPTIVIIVANVALVGRVVRSTSKFRRNQTLISKRQRKLTLELLIISSVYTIGWTPSTILAILQQIWPVNFPEMNLILDYFDYISYFVCPLQPFVCLIALPDLTRFIKHRIRRWMTHSTVTLAEGVMRGT